MHRCCEEQIPIHLILEEIGFFSRYLVQFDFFLLNFRSSTHAVNSTFLEVRLPFLKGKHFAVKPLKGVS